MSAFTVGLDAIRGCATPVSMVKHSVLGAGEPAPASSVPAVIPATVPAKSGISSFLALPSEEMLKKHAGTLAGMLLGTLLWKKHRVLGLITGGATGSAVQAFINGTKENQTEALEKLGLVAAGVTGSLMLHKPIKTWYDVRGAAGYLGGAMLAEAGLYAVTGKELFAGKTA